MDIKQRHELPEISGLLNRPRITGLIEEGIKEPLFIITASPGYGKTYAALSALHNAPQRLMWMRATKLDSLTTHFWRHFISCISREFPHLTEELEAIGFPDTLAKADSFLRALAEEVYSGEAVILAIDEYDNIQNNEVNALFEHIVDAGLENFCLMLLGRKKTNVEVFAAKNSAAACILGDDDLRFTPNEIDDFFRQGKISLPDEIIYKIYKDTDGWPLMVYLLSLKLKEKKNPDYEKSLGQSLEAVSGMYEKEFYLAYSAQARKLLVLLSLLQNFTLGVVKDVMECDLKEADYILNNNVFINYDHQQKEFFFQNLYREFLAAKQEYLPTEEKNRVYSIAGDDCRKRGMLIRAIEYYSLSGRYDDMMESMIDFLGSSMVLSVDNADFINKKLNALPRELAADNFKYSYLKVCLLIQRVEPEKALDALQLMEQSLLKKSGDKARLMLGEVYERMAGVYMMMSKVCAMDYYKKAFELLPEGSAYKPKNLLRFKNYSVFSLEEYTAGAMQRMENALYDGIDYMVHVENGAAAGFHYLYSTEAAFYTYDFDRAEIMAHRTVLEARPAQQHDLVCDAYFVLAKTYCMKGEYDKMLGAIEKIKQYVNEIDIPEMYEVSESAATWLELRMGRVKNIPEWFKTEKGDIASMLPLVVGRGEVLYGVYLLLKQKYTTLIAYFEKVKDWFLSKGWGDRMSTVIILAYAYLKVGNEEKAVDAFKELYDMTYHNGIITPFIEMGNMMRSFIEHVKKNNHYDFDDEWLENISRKASTYAKRLAYMVKEHSKNNSYKPEEYTLSGREHNILLNLFQGLTRDEIAWEIGISVNTVKSVIKSIYNKLGAVNRADAVRIAADKGMLT